MSRKHHTLKTETKFYQAAESGLKKFEIRINDRDFQVGDWVILEEVVLGTATGRKMPPAEIKYILHGPIFGLEDGWCILQF